MQGEGGGSHTESPRCPAAHEDFGVLGDSQDVRRTAHALRLLLARQILEETADLVPRLNVVKDAETLA
ncbi:hypothetical protein ACFZBP_38060 [Streptomyces sp. NPDC008086]|uniref:hypothetical protein n=1 Tax=Streptomyces sp. NPDC008086 TaxID=3364807 RepID=UPI0036E15D57